MTPDLSRTSQTDIICLSHLRWGFVFQRPQHLMSRFAGTRRVYFLEEPVFEEASEPRLRREVCGKTGVVVMTPVLPESLRAGDGSPALRTLLDQLISRESVRRFVAWYYTPMALRFSSHLTPDVTVYDCMDELSLFRGAPPQLCEYETQLLRRADVVFTGGVSLFEAKRHRHSNIFPCPSGVDVDHFSAARLIRESPADQADIARPRIGYAGVIDERLDLQLIAEVAELRPEWQLVMIGPVVKIDPATLPRRANIHWLGMKDYRDLPKYFAGWDIGMLPFALNDSTRFISPTKTPEYLAAGLSVVSTPIRDVVRPYGDLGLACIAKDAQEFVGAVEKCRTYGLSYKWRQRADNFLHTHSWDDLWGFMAARLEEALAIKTPKPAVMAAGKSRIAVPGERAHV